MVHSAVASRNGAAPGLALGAVFLLLPILGWWVRGHAGADSARLAVPVSGSRSEGILRVEAQRAGNGAWTFSHLVLDVTDNTMRLSLLEKERRRKKQSPPPPIKVPPRYQE